MNAFEGVQNGLEKALAFANGDAADAAVHEVTETRVNVAEVREQTGLSQAAFAKTRHDGPRALVLSFATVPARPRQTRSRPVCPCCRGSRIHCHQGVFADESGGDETRR